MKKITTWTLPVGLMLFLIGCKKNGGSNDNPKKAMVTTIAGTGENDYLDASALFAKFSSPADVAVHANGTIYIADRSNFRIRKLDPNGFVHTVAGNGDYGAMNGPVALASFRLPWYIDVDVSGNLYVLDILSSQVRKITGTGVTTFAGSDFGFADGRSDTARFSECYGITIHKEGHLYIVDATIPRIRKIANGLVTTIAGTGVAGFRDGNALQAQFSSPRGIAIDGQGNLYIGDHDNYRIRKITPAGVVSTFAGNGTQGYADGVPGTAQFYSLLDMVIDKKGNLYVADNNRIRKISPAGEVTTIAGDQQAGFADGEGSQARLRTPTGLGIDADGNIYIADTGNHRIRKISFE